MNVMNRNNIDNRVQSKHDISTKGINMGEQNNFLIKLRTSASEGALESTVKSKYKEHIDVARPTKVVSSSDLEGKKKRKRKSPLIPWKKPEGMPKRPLSAYNLFFQDRRKSIMLAASESNENLQDKSKQSHRRSTKKRSGVGFANLARTIGTEWRALEPEMKAPYDSLAANDKKRYDKEMKVWRAKEKEEKLMRESESGAKNQPFDCVAALPSFVSMSAARDVMGQDHATRDTSFPLTDLIGGGLRCGDQSIDVLQPLKDHESRGVFNPSMYNNFSNNSYSMDASSDQQSAGLIQHQQQDTNSFASRQLSQFNNSIGREHLDPYSNSTMNGVGFHNQPFSSSGGIISNNHKMMSWSNPRTAMIMENMLASSIDLEPLPLPDNHQEYHHTLYQKTNRDNQMMLSNQLLSQQQMQTIDQQQRINIDSNNQYLRRVSTTGGSSFHSSGWGQNASFSGDANEPLIVPLADGNVIHETNEKNIMSANAAMVSQELDSMDNAKTKNRPNQDPWKPIGLFNEESK